MNPIHDLFLQDRAKLVSQLNSLKHEIDKELAKLARDPDYVPGIAWCGTAAQAENTARRCDALSDAFAVSRPAAA